MPATVDTQELEAKVKKMYRLVAEQPGGEYHFEREDVVDLGRRSGMDAFFAALEVGESGSVVGVDFVRLRDLQQGDQPGAREEEGVRRDGPRPAPRGRLAIADIVSERQLRDSIACDADLWASCIGGASQEDAYPAAIEAAGMKVAELRKNPYEFISERAVNASEICGVKSVSVLARKKG